MFILSNIEEVVVIINPAYIPHLQVNQIIILVCINNT